MHTRSRWFVTWVSLFAAPGMALAQPHPGGESELIDARALRPVPLAQAGWSLALPGGLPLATPAIAGGLVFIGGGFGSHEMYALDLESGNVRWAARVSDDGPTAAVVEGGRVAFNTESCTLFVLDAATGRRLWSWWLGDPLMSQPAAADGRLYMAYPGGGTHQLTAFDLATGRPLWTQPIQGDLISAPVIEHDDVWAATTAGHVYRFAGQDGRVVFARNERVTSAPWVVDGKMYVSLHDEDAASRGPVEGLGSLDVHDGSRDQGPGQTLSRRGADWLDEGIQAASRYRIESGSGDSFVGFGGGAPDDAEVEPARQNLGRGTVSELWEYQGSRPVVRGGTSYSTMGDEVRAVDVRSGRVLWQHHIGGNLREQGGHLAAPPALVGDQVVTATIAGEVVGLDAATGAVRWTRNAGEPVRSQVAIAGGRVVVGTTAGHVVAFDLGDPSLDGWTMWGGGASHVLRDPAWRSHLRPVAGAGRIGPVVLPLPPGAAGGTTPFVTAIAALVAFGPAALVFLLRHVRRARGVAR